MGEGGKPTLRQTRPRPRTWAQSAFKDSMVHIICNSHYVSHFAAFFIVAGAKISVVESCHLVWGGEPAPEGTASAMSSVLLIRV